MLHFFFFDEYFKMLYMSMDDNGMYGIMQDESDGDQKNSLKKMKTVGTLLQSHRQCGVVPRQWDPSQCREASAFAG